MFTADGDFLLFDYFRVPYRRSGDIGDLGTVRADATGRLLLYPRRSSTERPQAFALDAMRLFGSVVDECDMQRRLPDDGWEPLSWLRLQHGAATAAWRNARGDVALAFDPAEIVTSFWSEAWAAGRWADHAWAGFRRAYYCVRPALPRPAQIAARRAVSHVQARAAFPAWPVENSLHDFYDWMFALLKELAGSPIPAIDLWPDGHRWALVLTHDVETECGLANIHLLREIERVRGYSSSWSFVPRRYEVGRAVVEDLRSAGCEVAVHGLRHDGRDVRPLSSLMERLPEMRRYAESWGAVGFRSPATHRDWDAMRLLGFDYDSSYPDTDPFEPQPGGCCSWLPFFNESLVELPITLTQDHTLLTILRRDERGWIEKARHLRDRGGMALLLTHPDYMLTRSARGAYARFLDAFAEDGTVWRALPREVSEWWRRRAASSLGQGDGGWVVTGPASTDGRVVAL